MPKIYHFVVNNPGETANKEIGAFWLKLRRMNFELYQKYWDRVDEAAPDQAVPMIDIVNTHCTEWQDEKSNRYCGMIKRKSD